MIRPVVAGVGKPALPTDARAELELVDERRFTNGVVYLRYRTSYEQSPSDQSRQDDALATAPRVPTWGIRATGEEVDEFYATLAETWLGVPAGDLLPGSPTLQ